MRSAKIAGCLLICIFAGIPRMVFAADQAAASDKVQQAGVYVQAGETLASEGNWKLAKEEFSQAAKVDPGSVVALYDLGVAQAHLGELEEAAQSQRRAVELDPRYSAAFIELGWILSRLHKYDEALELERKALELDPGNKIAQRNVDTILKVHHRGRLTMPGPSRARNGRVESAAVVAGQPSEILVGSDRDSYSAQALQSLLAAGEKAFREGQLEVARRSFEQSVLLSPENARGHAALGVVLGKQGNVDGQLAEERRAAELDPKDASIQSNIGWAEAKKQHWSESLRAYQTAVATKPDFVDAQVGLALALFNTGKKKQATLALNETKEKHPESAAPSLALGWMRLEQGELGPAEEELRNALRVQPESAEAKQQLAIVLLRSGRAGDAADLFRQVSDSSNRGAAAHAGLSIALELQGDIDGAEKEARRALDLDPKLQIAQLTLDRLVRKKATVK